MNLCYSHQLSSVSVVGVGAGGGEGAGSKVEALLYCSYRSDTVQHIYTHVFVNVHEQLTSGWVGEDIKTCLKLYFMLNKLYKNQGEADVWGHC